MTEKEAHDKVARINSRNTTSEYCPLIRDFCKTYCVCYAPARAVRIGAEWETREGYCDNPMLIRE